MSRQLLIVIAACLAAISTASAQTRAVEDDEQLFNWYYAAIYGTGIYSAGDRTVGVLQAPLSFTLRKSSEDQWGLRLTLPVSFGFYDFNFDEFANEGLPSRVSTFSVLPGIEFEKRVLPRWLLRPYVSGGAGWEVRGDESALLYDAGVRSRFRLGDDRGTIFSLVNWLSLAGYDPSGGSSQSLGLFAIGLDVQAPTGQTLFDRPIVLSILPIYYYYFNKLGFAEITDRDNTVREESEIALSILAKEPFSFWRIDVDRIGVAIRTSADVSGFRIFTSLPF